MLIHNGGSIFHDFQLSIDPELMDTNEHSYPLKSLLIDCLPNMDASKLVWKWIEGDYAPEGSVTRICDDLHIPVLLFTGLACDYWQMFGETSDWSALGVHAFWDFKKLTERFRRPFHYICMGSAVIHPEVFIKAVSLANSIDFKADVVDFLDMYRPRTRVAKFGKYYQMEHKEYLQKWIKNQL